MSKWKERIDKILTAERERIEKKLKEAEGNYRDTGYSRYFKQMEKCEIELAEIEDFQKSGIKIAKAENIGRRYEKAINKYREKMDDYVRYHKGMERPIEETVEALKTRLYTALQDEGV